MAWVRDLVAVLVLLGASVTAFSKEPGGEHCARNICHRVRTVAETQALVGEVRVVEASYYDDMRVDPMNAGEFTSDGERFDASSPSRVASSDLPDGTELLVRNPENGRTAHVRVNDFGPFEGERRLDVTRRVAEDLGFTHKGVTPIEVIVLTAPLPEDLVYRRQRNALEPLGYLGVVDKREMPALAESLIAMRTRAPLNAAAVVSESLHVESGLASDVVAHPVIESEVDLDEVTTDPGAPDTQSLALPPSVELVPAVSKILVPVRPAILAAVRVLGPGEELLANANGPAFEIAVTDVGEMPIETPIQAWLAGAGAAIEAPHVQIMTLATILSVLLGLAMMPARRKPRRVVGSEFAVLTRVSSRRALPAPRERALPLTGPTSALLALPAPAPVSGTRIGADTWIEGTLMSMGDIAIAGHVRGPIAAERVVLEEGAVVEGAIEAVEVAVNGRFDGPIRAHLAHFGPSAEYTGTLTTRLLIVEPGASMEAAVRLEALLRIVPDAAPVLLAESGSDDTGDMRAWAV
jgi:cytoskeletal protein CcmA (bactofilin family)